MTMKDSLSSIADERFIVIAIKATGFYVVFSATHFMIQFARVKKTINLKVEIRSKQIKQKK